MPVELVIDLPERPSAAIETIAYFCAAELLTNVAKHSGARHATLEVVHVPGLVRVVVSDDGSGGARIEARGGLAGLAERVRTVDGRLQVTSPRRGPHRGHRRAAVPRLTEPEPPMRIVIAEDSAVVRAGLAEILADRGHEVVAAVGNAEDLLAAVEPSTSPDVTVVDVRMPPGYTDEGLRAAIAIRRDHPKTGVLVFSQYIETRYAADLLGAASGGGAAGVGYLLKDRVADVGEFVEALSRVAAGGTALDPEVVTQLLRRQPPHRRARLAHRQGARRAGADGRGPVQRRDRRDSRGLGAGRREARREHLQQARPGAVGRRSPPGARRPPLPGVLTGCCATRIRPSRALSTPTSKPSSAAARTMTTARRTCSPPWANDAYDTEDQRLPSRGTGRAGIPALTCKESRGAGDENRPRTISLGMSETGRPDRSSRRPAGALGSVSYRESPCPTDPSGTQRAR